MAKRKTHRKGLHDGGGSIFRKAASNIRMNAKAETFKRAGFGILGALLYAVVPTAIQGWFKKDMSGWKGVLTGLFSSSIIGMAINKPEMVVGAFAGFSLHFTYIYANDTLATFLGSPIFRFSATSNTTIPLAPAKSGVSDTPLGPNQRIITTPDGKQLIAATAPQAMSDYQATISDYQATISDYQSTIDDGYRDIATSTNTMRDYQSTLKDSHLFDRTMTF